MSAVTDPAETPPPPTKKHRSSALSVPIVGVFGLKESEDNVDPIQDLLSNYNVVTPWSSTKLLDAAHDAKKIMENVWDKVLPAVASLLGGAGALKINNDEQGWTAPYARTSCVCVCVCVVESWQAPLRLDS